MTLQVQTPAGLMEVQVPDGVGPGMSFQMQVPAVPQAAPPPAAPAPLPADDYLKGELAEGWAAGGRKDELAAEVARFKATAAATAGDSPPAEPTMLEKTIDTLGTVLTYNFFIIITFFMWFLAGVVGQFGLQSTFLIESFRGAWDFLIQPLLTTHMTLTFLSWGLEKASQGNEESA